MEGGWKTPPPPSATTRQKSPVLIGLKGQWQGWHNTDCKDLIFIMVPCKVNAHRDESTNLEADELVTSYNYLGKVTLKFGTGS